MMFSIQAGVTVQVCAAVRRVRMAASVSRSVPTVTRVAAEIDSLATTVKSTPTLVHLILVLTMVPVFIADIGSKSLTFRVIFC